MAGSFEYPAFGVYGCHGCDLAGLAYIYISRYFALQVLALEKMGLVSWECDNKMGEGSDHDGADISGVYVDFESLRVYEKFFKKVMERNPAYDTRRRIQDEAMVRFDAMPAPSGIMVLHLCECEELEVVDLSGLRKLRSLSIWGCPKLREMIGWECLKDFGWLEIHDCPLYDGYPPLQKIPSLQGFRFWPPDVFSNPALWVRGEGELDVSGCVRLRRLEIFGDYALSSIRGLEGLRSLTVLDLCSCIALRNLPDIGHMKDPTHLTITWMAVEEIKGVENLLSLEELNCRDSKLKTLPDLSHLPHLREVKLYKCPLVNDPSSPYYKKNVVQFKRGDKHGDVSDTSDSECEVSGEEI
jgi:hypothetical protein